MYISNSTKTDVNSSDGSPLLSIRSNFNNNNNEIMCLLQRSKTHQRLQITGSSLKVKKVLHTLAPYALFFNVMMFLALRPTSRLMHSSYIVSHATISNYISEANVIAYFFIQLGWHAVVPALPGWTEAAAGIHGPGRPRGERFLPFSTLPVKISSVHTNQ